MENGESKKLQLRLGALVVLIGGGLAIMHSGSAGVWKFFYFYLAAMGAVTAGVFDYRPGMAPEDVRKIGKKWFITSLFFFAAAGMGAMGWQGLLLVYIFFVAALAVGAILMQSGRGGGLAASFGGVGGDSLLGARSALPIAKATYVMLALLLFSCLLVGTAIAQKDGGASKEADAPVEQPVDANAPQG